jgi:hypothetical protein
MNQKQIEAAKCLPRLGGFFYLEDVVGATSTNIMGIDHNQMGMFDLPRTELIIWSADPNLIFQTDPSNPWMTKFLEKHFPGFRHRIYGVFAYPGAAPRTFDRGYDLTPHFYVGEGETHALISWQGSDSTDAIAALDNYEGEVYHSGGAVGYDHFIWAVVSLPPEESIEI